MGRKGSFNAEGRAEEKPLRPVSVWPEGGRARLSRALCTVLRSLDFILQQRQTVTRNGFLGENNDEIRV